MSTDWRSTLVDRLGSLISSAGPEVTREIKWCKPSNPDGVPTYSSSGLICTVETFKDKVKVTFARGASLPDPSGLFNASLDAGTRRAIDLPESTDLDETAFTELVASAIAFNQT